MNSLVNLISHLIYKEKVSHRVDIYVCWMYDISLGILGSLPVTQSIAVQLNANKINFKNNDLEYSDGSQRVFWVY